MPAQIKGLGEPKGEDPKGHCALRKRGTPQTLDLGSKAYSL